MPYKHGVTGSSPVVPTIYLARWCSRLARQPVTLEVDGSSPFRVATKKHAFQRAFLSFCQRTPAFSKRRQGVFSVGAASVWKLRLIYFDCYPIAF